MWQLNQEQREAIAATGFYQGRGYFGPESLSIFPSHIKGEWIVADGTVAAYGASPDAAIASLSELMIREGWLQ